MNSLISKWKACVKEMNITVEDLEGDEVLTNRLLDTLNGILDETGMQMRQRGGEQYINVCSREGYIYIYNDKSRDNKWVNILKI